MLPLSRCLLVNKNKIDHIRRFGGATLIPEDGVPVEPCDSIVAHVYLGLSTGGSGHDTMTVWIQALTKCDEVLPIETWFIIMHDGKVCRWSPLDERHRQKAEMVPDDLYAQIERSVAAVKKTFDDDDRCTIPVGADVVS